MIFTETRLKGVYFIEPELLTDERGFFARSFCKEEFQKYGLETDIVQCNISFNKRKGTLRGMHYQIPPHEEAKIVSCTKGSIYDVVVDLRKDSLTYSRYVATELSEKNFKMMYIPRGCAHGFQTMEDEVIVYYQMTGLFHPECARGIRWDDPAIGIVWPGPPGIISEKDQRYKGLTL
jgi:dTDP-4-dehydrorhamnose 3,5-epimerase